MPQEPIDLSRVRTIPLTTRPNKVALTKFARPPVKGQSVTDFVAGLPHILAGDDFRAVVDAFRREGYPVYFTCVEGPVNQPGSLSASKATFLAD